MDSDGAMYSVSNSNTAPLVSSWMSKIKLADTARKDFMTVAKHCRVFYKASNEFWKRDGGIYASYMDADVRPKFQMTFAKVFEAVASFGPLLYHKNPKRHSEPQKQLPVLPSLFPKGQMPPPPPGMPPQQMQQWQQQMQQQIDQAHQQQVQQQQRAQHEKHEVNAVRAEVTEQVLNRMTEEQPGGGLYGHSRRAVQESIVTGRGCLWTELYRQPGSDQLLSGSFYYKVEDLFIDPDCRTPDLSDAYWIARKVVEPAHVVEQKYGLPEGSLKGSNESSEMQSEREHVDDYGHKKRNGETHDLVTYYLIWSKSGIGYRHTNAKSSAPKNEFVKTLDKFAGDFVHLAICPTCEYPLNLPPDVLDNPDVTDEEIQQRVKWPIEHWRDNSWPVCMLDYYEDENSPWPIAPWKPALGEIVFVNVMLSALANRIYETSQDIIGVQADSYDSVVEGLNKNANQKILKIDTNGSQSLNEVIQVWQNRTVNFDAWKIIDEVMQNIERRTGLTDLMQGQMNTQDRSAEATSARKQQMMLRPDDMASQVEQWARKCALNERLALHSYVKGKDVQMMLGDYGAWIWDTYIVSQPIEVVLREFDVTLEAGSTRKPNKERKVTQLQELTPVVMPFLQGYASTTGDTAPVKWWLTQMGESIDMDMSGLNFGRMAPPPPPPEVQQQQQQAQQQQQQGEQAKLQVDVQKGQMDLEGKRIDLQGKQMEMASRSRPDQSQILEDQLQMARMQQEHVMRSQQMQSENEQRVLEVHADRAKTQMDMQLESMKAQAKQQEMAMRMSRLFNDQSRTEAT